MTNHYGKGNDVGNKMEHYRTLFNALPELHYYNKKNDDKKNKYNICGNIICNNFIWTS